MYLFFDIWVEKSVGTLTDSTSLGMLLNWDNSLSIFVQKDGAWI